MASIVGRLARTLSQGPEEAHRRGASLGEGGVLGPAPATPMASPRLSTSPSFNDFSLSVHEDAEEEYRSVFAGPGGMKAIDQPQGAQCNDLAAGSQTIEGVLLPKDAAAATAAHAPLRSKARSVKVMGMDAYDYCDLLRSGSL